MVKRITSFFIFLAASVALAQSPQSSYRLSGAPGKLQIEIANLATTQTLTLVCSGGVSKSVTKTVTPTNPVIKIAVLDSPASYLLTLYDDAGTTLTGPAPYTQPKWPEDYAWGLEGGAAIRLLMHQVEGEVKYDGTSYGPLTNNQKVIFELRLRVMAKLVAQQALRDRATRAAAERAKADSLASD